MTTETDVLSEAISMQPTTSEGDPLDVLVGEGKKFRSPSDLAKAKLESDAFINKLQSENRELRTIVESLDSKVKSQDVLTELIERVSRGSQPTIAGDPSQVTSNNTASTDTRNQSVALTPEDVLNLLDQRDKAKSVAANRKFVNSKLSEMYGEKAVEVVRQRASELGLTDKAVFQLAESSPKAFLKLVSSNVESAGTVNRSGAAGRGTVNSQALFAGNPGGDVRNDGYYSKLKTEMGSVKFATDTSIQVQMHKDMERLGDSFFQSN
jgi:hypothetical protein